MLKYIRASIRFLKSVKKPIRKRVKNSKKVARGHKEEYMHKQDYLSPVLLLVLCEEQDIVRTSENSERPGDDWFDE